MNFVMKKCTSCEGEWASNREGDSCPFCGHGQNMIIGGVDMKCETRRSTQGRKGEKLPRINMAFSDKNHEYITIAARLHGKSVTRFVNDLIDVDREANGKGINALAAMTEFVLGKK